MQHLKLNNKVTFWEEGRISHILYTIQWETWTKTRRFMEPAVVDRKKIFRMLRSLTILHISDKRNLGTFTTSLVISDNYLSETLPDPKKN